MGIQINGNTNNINAGIGSLSIEDLNELHIVGVATASNFKTGTSNVHNVGIEIAGINVLGADTPIGVGATIYNSGGAIFAGTSGVVTATAFHGSGAQLTGITQTTINSNVNNYVVTATGTANTLQGEANLQFDGTNIGVGVAPSGVSSYSTIHLKGPSSGNGAAIRLQDYGDTADSDDFTIYKNSSAGYLRINGTDPLIAYMNGAERLRIDSVGRVLIGRTASRNVGGSTTYAKLQVAGTSQSTSSISVVNNENSTAAAFLFFGKTRGGSVGASTIVQNGDTLGGLSFIGADGNDTNNRTAEITAVVNGGPGNNEIPTDLTFSTSPTHAGSLVERMRIYSSGRILIGNGASEGGPSGNLDIVGDTNSNGPELYLRVSNNNTADNIGALLFGNNVDKSVVKIQGVTHTANNTGDLTFHTSTTGTMSEKFRIDSSGDLTIPTTDAKIKLKDGNNYIQFVNADKNFKFMNAWGAGEFTFNVNGGERLRIASAGQIGLGGANYGTSGQFLQSQGSGSAVQWATPSGATRGSTITASSGSPSVHTLSSISSDVYRVIINVSEISMSGNGYFYYRVGHSGGSTHQTNNYHGLTAYHYYDVTDSTRSTFTDRFGLTTTNFDYANNKYWGFIVLDRIAYTGSDHYWYARGHVKHEYGGSVDTRMIIHSHGFVKTGSNAVDKISLYCSAGTYDGGYIRFDTYT